MIFNAIPDELSDVKSNREFVPPFDNEEKREVMHIPSIGSPPFNLSNETTFIVQLHEKYILSQIKSGLMIIDQHAAHERVLYEKALERLEVNLPFSQQLLFPKTVELNPGMFALVKEINPFLKLTLAIRILT